MPSVVKIYFGGIGVFFNNLSAFVPGVSVARMVLPNANIDQIMMGGSPVSVFPHVALLTPSTPFTPSGQLPPADTNFPGSFDLNTGGPYTITFPPNEGEPWLNFAGCLPHLQETLAVPIGPPSSSVIAEGDAACYVDFTQGSIEGFSREDDTGIAVAAVRMPENSPPQITITGPNGTGTMTFDGSEVAIISITNKPADTTADEPNDFYLNFLTCETTPPAWAVTIPTRVSCPFMNRLLLPPIFWNWEAGPGCSNTNYP